MQAITPFFIVGTGRSGTTLLQVMLDSHPEIAVAPETVFFDYWHRSKIPPDLHDDSQLTRFLDEYLLRPNAADLCLEREVLLNRALSGPRTCAALFLLLISFFAANRKVSVMGEKTPKHLFRIAFIHETFPLAKFIYIYRDPRPVCQSVRAAFLAKGNQENRPTYLGSCQKHTAHWLEGQEFMAKIRKNLPLQVLEVRYETMLHEPEQTCRQACTFLNLDYHPRMLEYHQRTDLPVDTQREPHKLNIHRPILTDRALQWRNELSRSERLTIEAMTEPWLVRWNYPLDFTAGERTGERIRLRLQTLLERIRDGLKRRLKSVLKIRSKRD